MRLLALVLLMAALCACSMPAGGLAPGRTTLPQVIERMGEPSMAWSGQDGSLQLEFSRLPGGNGNFMAWIGRDGVLQRLDQVLTVENVGRLERGMSRDQVRRLLGRPARVDRPVTVEIWHWPLDAARPTQPARWQVDAHFGADGVLVEVGRSRIDPGNPAVALAGQARNSPL